MKVREGDETWKKEDKLFAKKGKKINVTISRGLRARVTAPASRRPRHGARVGYPNGLPRSCESSKQSFCCGNVFNYCQLSIAVAHIDGFLSLGHVWMFRFTCTDILVYFYYPFIRMLQETRYNQQNSQFNSKLQPTRCNVSWFIYFYRRSTCFRVFLHPSSGAHNCTYCFRYCQPILLLAAIVDEMELISTSSTLAASSSIGWQYLKQYVQLCAPDDGRRNRLKHVERL